MPCTASTSNASLTSVSRHDASAPNMLAFTQMVVATCANRTPSMTRSSMSSPAATAAAACAAVDSASERFTPSSFENNTAKSLNVCSSITQSSSSCPLRSLAGLQRAPSASHHGVSNDHSENEVAAALFFSELLKRQQLQYLQSFYRLELSISGDIHCRSTTTAAVLSTAKSCAAAAAQSFKRSSCNSDPTPQQYFDPGRGEVQSPVDHGMVIASPLTSSTSRTWQPIISNEYFVMEDETSGSEVEDDSEEEEAAAPEMFDLWGEEDGLNLAKENELDLLLLSDPHLAEAICRPRVFNEGSSMAFYMTPLAMATMVQGLLSRHESACVHMNLRIPREYLFDDMDWSSDALRMLCMPNAGGSSHLSEVLSFEILHRCLGADLAETEMEIRYFFAYQPITDYTITVSSLAGLVGHGHGHSHGPVKLGVSVTRAFSFRGPYRRVDCRKLLRKKLRGIIASSKNVVGGKLYKQILHVLVPSGKVARTVHSTWKRMPAELIHNTVVVVSIVNAPWVFSNRR